MLDDFDVFNPQVGDRVRYIGCLEGCRCKDEARHVDHEPGSIHIGREGIVSIPGDWICQVLVVLGGYLVASIWHFEELQPRKGVSHSNAD